MVPQPRLPDGLAPQVSLFSVANLVGVSWTRVAGIALLAAGAALTLHRA